MFTGDYNFFEYKYNIQGYSGQDYGGLAQWLYLGLSIALIALLLYLMRNTPREKVKKILAYAGVFMTLFYIGKTAWESVYDIRRDGAFNVGILPLDSCSIVMPALLLAGFGRGKPAHLAECWLASGGILGGFGTMLFLNAFKYYPFFSFGAFYSMLWHFLMVFLGLLTVVTGSLELSPAVPLKGFLFHLAISAVVIPLDFIFKWDFMMYREMSSIPIFNDIGAKLLSQGREALNPPIMLAVYFAAFFVIYALLCLGKMLHRCVHR